jgi:hypothetical protein
MVEWGLIAPAAKYERVVANVIRGRPDLRTPPLYSGTGMTAGLQATRAYEAGVHDPPVPVSTVQSVPVPVRPLRDRKNVSLPTRPDSP